MLLCIMSKLPKNKRNPDVPSGLFLLLTGISLAAAFLTRFELIGIITDFSEDFEYLSDSRFILKINSSLWILTAILMTFLSASLFSSMKIYRNPSAYYIIFFFILTAVMLSISGIKGWGIIETLSYQEEKVINILEDEYIKASLIGLEKERDLYIRFSVVLIGIDLFSLGLFSMKTLRIPLFFGLILLLTGLSLPVLVVFFPQNPLYYLVLVISVFTIISVGIRLIFHGFIRKKKKVSAR